MFFLQGHTASRESTSSLFLLLDLMTFFDRYHAKKFDDAVDVVQRIRLVPLAQSEVDPLVSNFRVLQDEVRRNVPDLLLAAMTILFTQYKQGKAGGAGAGVGSPVMGQQQLVNSGRERHLEALREKAKALITFAGMIPYR